MPDGPPAIDGDVLARHIARRIRCEEQDGALKVVAADFTHATKWGAVAVVAHKASLEAAVEAAEGDWHAGWVETSMVMALAPELVQMDKLQMDDALMVDKMREHPDNYQCASKPFEHECVVPRLIQRPDIKVGVMGAPAEASVERGREIVEDAVNQLSRIFEYLEQNRSQRYRPVEWVPDPIILTS